MQLPVFSASKVEVIRSTIPRFCVAHKEPQISKHLYDAVIDTPSLPDYETLVSVTAQPVLMASAPNGLVSVCTYRKIVVRGAISHGQIGVAACRTIPREDTEPPAGFDFLVCMHNFAVGRVHRNVWDQWCGCHHEADLRDALKLAIEMGIFTLKDAERLKQEPALVEGGFSVGVFPGHLVRESLTLLVPFYNEFARRYKNRFMKYDPVQRRCIAFLAERMETHFILKELRHRYPEGIPTQIAGTLTTVNDGPRKPGTMPA